MKKSNTVKLILLSATLLAGFLLVNKANAEEPCSMAGVPCTVASQYFQAATGPQVLGASTSATGVGMSSCYAIGGRLRYGSTDAATGGAVSDLQRFLANQGFFKLEPTTIFGHATEQALMAFQKKNHIEQVPSTGPQTRAAITRICLATPVPDDVANSIVVTTLPPVTSSGTTTAASFVASSDRYPTPSTNIVVNAGEVVRYAWSAVNADTFSAVYRSPTPAQCGADGSWKFANNAGGTVSATVSSAQAGCVYVITYTATNSANGQTVSVPIQVSVNPKDPALSYDGSVVRLAPTATFVIDTPSATSSHNVVINPGETVTYKWNSTNADKASSSYTSNNAACGAGLWVVNTIAGSASYLASQQGAGCVYTITYTATQSSTGATASDTIVQRINNSVAPITTGTLPAPTASLLVGTSTASSHTITVRPGDTVKYAWNSTNADKITSDYSSNSASCGTGPWVVTTIAGSSSYLVPITQIGCSYTINYNATQSSTGLKAKDSVTVIVTQSSVGNSGSSGTVSNYVAPAPTASLTVNGSHDLALNVGDNANFVWSSTNADRGTSAYTATPSNAASCGTGGAWAANSINGSVPNYVVPVSQAGCVWVMTYTVTNSSTGASASDTMHVRVNALAAPTASLLGSSPRSSSGSHNFFVNVGQPVTYNWTSTGGDKFSSYYTSNSTACGSSASSVMNTANGTFTATVPQAQAGCVYTSHYVVTQTSTGATAEDIVVETVNDAGTIATTPSAPTALTSTPTIQVTGTNQSGSSTALTATFSLNTTASGGTLTKPSSSNFVIKFATSSSAVQFPASSVNVVTIPNSDISNGSTAAVTVTAQISNADLPANGLYYAYVSSLQWVVGGTTISQSGGLDNLKTSASANFVK